MKSKNEIDVVKQENLALKSLTENLTLEVSKLKDEIVKLGNYKDERFAEIIKTIQELEHEKKNLQAELERLKSLLTSKSSSKSTNKGLSLYKEKLY